MRRGAKFLIKSSQDDISQICTRHTPDREMSMREIDENR